MSSLRPWFLAAIAGVLTSLAAAAIPSTAAATPVFGVQGVSNASATALRGDLATARRVHASLIRVQASWATLQPASGDTYDPDALAALDRIVNTAASQHVKVLLFGDDTPCWASSAPAATKAACKPGIGGGATRYPPSDPSSFARFAAFLSQRYGAKLAAFQIWNEPDQSSEDYWAGPDKVAKYVQLMKATYPAIKSVAPRLPVLAGSFVGGNGAWLDAMFRAGAKGFYDGLAVQFYDLPLQALRTTRAVQRRYGDTKPLWITEFGWSSCYRRNGPTLMDSHYCLTRAGQAQTVIDLLRAVRKISWIKSAVLYRLRDESTAYQFGILDRVGHRKPLYAKLANTAARRGSLRRPTARVALRSGKAVVSGTASIADVVKMTVKVNGILRFRATLRTTRFGTYRLALPKSIGTSALRVSVRSAWSGRGVTVKR